MKHLRFDNGTSGALALAVARAETAYQPDGTVVAINTARYDNTRTIISPPATPTNIIVTAQNCDAAASGRSLTGGSLVVATHVNPTTVYIRKDGAALRSKLILVDSGAKSGKIDLLWGEAGEETGASSRRYEPTAWVVCHGTIFAWCEVSETTNNWVSESANGVALCYSQDEGATWALHARDVSLFTGNDSGNGWAMHTYWNIDRTINPTSVYIVACDYRNGTKNGGAAYAVRLTRASSSVAWTIGTMQRVVNASAATGNHWHCGAAFRHGASGLGIDILCGDGPPLNRVVGLWRSDETYDQGEGSSSDGGTANGWTTELNRHGNADWAAGTTPADQANQGVAICALSNAGDVLVGGDETQDSITRRTRYATDTSSQIGYSHVYGTSGSGDSEAAICFYIQGEDPDTGAGPYWAWEQVGNIGAAASRILYSEDGANWGVYAFRNNAQALKPAPADNGVYVGSNNGEGIDFFERPDNVETCRPMLVGPGATNYQKQTALTITNTSAEITVTNKTGANLTAEGIPTPPCAGPYYHVACTTGGEVVGRFRITEGMGGVPTGRCRVRLWIYMMAPGGSETTPSTQGAGITPLIKPFVQGAFATGGAFTDGPSIISGGHWHPVTFSFNSGDFSTPPGAAYELSIVLRAVNSTAGTTCKFYIAFDSVVAHATSVAWPSTAAASGSFGGETATVTGLTCGAQWTIMWRGMIADAAWDGLVTESPTAYVFTAYEDASTYTRVSIGATGVVTAYTLADGANESITVATGVVPRRLDPVFLALRRNSDGTITLSASVGGSVTATATTASARDVRPVQVQSGDESKATGITTGWREVAVNETATMTDAAIGMVFASGLAASVAGVNSTMRHRMYSGRVV